MKVGDVLIVHKEKNPYATRSREEFYLGVVCRVGRKYVYVRIDNHFYKEVRFHIETQLSMDSYFGNGYEFYFNLDELQRDLLLGRRKKALSNYGVNFSHRLSLDADRLRRVCEALDLEDAVYTEVRHLIDNLMTQMLQLSNNKNTEV